MIIDFLADCDSDDNHCISVGEAKDCIPGGILDLIPEEWQDLDDDIEVCEDHIDDLIDTYGDVIDYYLGNKK